MPWIDVSQKFTWKPKPNVMQDVEAGQQLVTTRCAEHAVKIGRAKRIKTPKREERPE
jgi:hypothetical protein